RFRLLIRESIAAGRDVPRNSFAPLWVAPFHPQPGGLAHDRRQRKITQTAADSRPAGPAIAPAGAQVPAGLWDFLRTLHIDSMAEDPGYIPHPGTRIRWSSVQDR